jgi:O-acetyl-ADP-ribose deacetylase (regulator of RNase III)
MADPRLTLVRGDITKLAIDAIINAANTTLLGGGGVDGAIHRAAGPELLVECKTLGGCRPGEAKITRGYSLPARFVIHTVGPVWSGGHRGEPETLANCYRNSLRLASENGLRTIAFPAISCGAYGYPIPDAAQIAVETTSEFLRENASITEVTFVVSSDEIEAAYQRLVGSS